MREILFRGKRTDGKGWLHGYYSYNPVMKIHWIRTPRNTYWDEDMVDPATVGQYTGLQDKRGQRIFEGDIVTGLFLFELPISGVVAFRDGSFGVKWMRGCVEEFNAFTICCNVEWEVIGNGVDNPELLESGVNDG